jgi:RND superfamily putative drug exporter
VLERVASLTWRRPKLVLGLVGVFVALAGGFGHDVERHLKAAGLTDSASESERATAFARSELGYDASPAMIALVRAPGGGRLDLSRASVRREVRRITRALSKTRYVGHVTSPLRGGRAGAALRERNGRSLVIAAHLATQDVEHDGGVATRDAKRRIGRSSLDVRLGGFAVSFEEIADQTRTDLARAELIAFPILAILLLLVFRGVVAAAIPLLLGVVSILGTFLMLRVMSGAFDTSLFALNIATGLSLGLAVDYGLLMVSRYREELDRGGGRATREVHRRTVVTAGRTVLFSGLTVATAIGALMVMPQRFLYSVGAAGAAVGLLSALIAVLVVPSILALLGTRINALAIRRGPAVSDVSSGWYRLAKRVMRRPVVVGGACMALLLVLASPVFSTKFTGASAEAVPSTQPSYHANAYVEQHYSQGVAYPIIVTVRGTTSRTQLALLHKRLMRVDGLDGGTPFVRASPDAAYASFAPDGEALAADVQNAVQRIREHHVPGGADLLVAGLTARFIDEKQSLVDGLPLVGAIIATTTLLLLFALTGSVILPIKTLIMNALTLSAALGVIVFAFQDGLLDGLFAYTGPAAIDLPGFVALMVVTFGLATDYAVLVMARMKEHHDRGASNEEAIALGLGATGRVITAAAAAIAVVFLAFGVSAVFVMKQIALGEAVAVLIDATLVRALLVPALMALLGEWNWWAPQPLRARVRVSEA